MSVSPFALHVAQQRQQPLNRDRVTERMYLMTQPQIYRAARPQTLHLTGSLGCLWAGASGQC